MSSSSSSLYRRLHGIFAAASTQKISVKLKPNNTQNQEHQKTINNFKKSCESPIFRRHGSNYIKAIRRLGDNLSAIEDIIEHQKQYPEIENEFFVSRLIILYGHARMYEQARKLFDEMPNLKCQRTVYSFNALLASCVRAANCDILSELFRELPEELSIKPDVVSYNTLIKGYCEAGSMDIAVSVMDEMDNHGIKPDEVTFNMLFNACYKSRRFSEAKDLWVLMQKKNVVADCLSYHMLLQCLAADNKVSEAIELFDEMGKKNIIPHCFSYNMMIKVHMDDGNLEETKIWYSKMVENGHYPDQETFKLLIDFACDKGNLDFALELCKKALDSKVTVPRPIMQRVVNGLAKNSKVEDAKELLNLTESYKRFRYTLSLPLLQ